MKNLFLTIICFALLSGCGSDNFNNNNPYLPNYNFSMEINTDLPSYNALKFPSNGVIIFNTGNSFTAYDGSCPNQAIATCSRLTISGINAVCPCQSEQYNLFTGLSTGKQYPLKPYRVEVNGSVIRVYN